MQVDAPTTKPENDAVTVVVNFATTEASDDFMRVVKPAPVGIVSDELRAAFNAVEQNGKQVRVVWSTESVAMVLKRADDLGGESAVIEEGWLIGERPEGATPQWYV